MSPNILININMNAWTKIVTAATRFLFNPNIPTKMKTKKASTVPMLPGRGGIIKLKV